MQVDPSVEATEPAQEPEKEKPYEPTPESDVYVRLLVILALLDAEKLDQVSWTSQGTSGQGSRRLEALCTFQA